MNTYHFEIWQSANADVNAKFCPKGWLGISSGSKIMSVANRVEMEHPIVAQGQRLMADNDQRTLTN